MSKLLLPVTLAVGIGLAVGAWSRFGSAPNTPGIEPPANAQGPRTVGDLKSLSATYADISKARELIGYDPHTQIAEGIPMFVEWFRASQT